MKKMALALIALLVVAGVGRAATLPNGTLITLVDFANDPYAAQIAYDSFNYSVKQRMAVARLGVNTAPEVNGRQIECNYSSGFTVWGGGYGSFAKQNTRDLEDGYKYRVGGPVLGFDWSSAGFTFGAAGTYNWGKMEARNFDHDRDTRTWGLAGYGQWTNGCFYVNGTVGYARNRYEGDHAASGLALDPLGVLRNASTWGFSDRYNSDSWNANAEVGYKFLLKNFSITPNVGVRYFYDRRKAFNDYNSLAVNGWGTANWTMHYGKNDYHVLELPVGVNLGYEFKAGNMVIVPQLRFAWIPELDRKHGNAEAVDNTGTLFYDLDSPSRNRNGFLFGTGVQAKLTSNISANLDYNVVLRSKAYEHHLNLGIGFSF